MNITIPTIKRDILINEQLSIFIAEYKRGVDFCGGDATSLTKMLEAYRKMSLEVALRKAGLCLDQDDKKHPHQWCIPNKSLKHMSELLPLNMLKFNNCTNFDNVLSVVIDIKDKANVINIGLLTQYDIAIRIGANLNKFPSEIYLHAGALDGARFINKKINVRKGSPNELFGEYATCFDGLLPYEAEDFLCVYKNQLKNLLNKGAV